MGKGNRSESEKGSSPRLAKFSISDKINLGLGLITFLLFIVAIYQTKLAYWATESAEQSARAAIDAVHVSEKQFEIQNTPYLILSKVDSVNFAPNEPLFMRWQLTNLGVGVARLDSMRGVFTYDLHDKPLNSVQEIEKLLLNSKEWSKTETYVANNFPAKSNLKFRERISSDGYTFIKNNFSSLNVAIEIYYTNLGNNKRRRCEVILKLFGSELGGIEIKRIVNSRLD
jgi:hypothetical protein